jgi:N-acetyl-gamma-glutamyl-phosphate reductase
MAQARVGVVGASGYSGAVAARLLATHPSFELAFATSDKLAGTSVADHLGVPLRGALAFAANGEARALAERCDAVVLATSAKVSAELAPAFVEAKKHVVDLSGAYRLDAGAYPRWYGFEHPSAGLLARAHYGLPELFGAPPKSEATLVSNPGCYPTATLLAIAPLVREGLVDAASVIVDAKSGVSGAGRQGSEAYSFTELDDSVHAYKLLSHQHTPEILRMLARFDAKANLTFTAHLVPLRRGLLATCYARPRAGATAERVQACLRDAYTKEPFVRVVAPDQVAMAKVAGTNLAYVGATAGDDIVIAIGAIDNLVKGAAGQAVQNLNLLFDLSPSTGLDHLQRFAP